MKLVTYDQASFWEETLQTVERRQTRFQVWRLFLSGGVSGRFGTLHARGNRKQVKAETNRNNGSGEVGGVLNIASDPPRLPD
ncbi:hypothetical protein [Hyphomonas sp.]|uniref:hypothetical protein n=1 Tax=Hyphomonas sp. TaxID=87 RepID=UPI003D286F41|tara:strand:- start:24981 stop:25226 length:246 start_codon:yes stop_codon:yes gene_type:complete